MAHTDRTLESAMPRRLLQLLAAGLIVVTGAACAAGASPPVPSPSAITFDGYAVAFCSAWGSLFDAVGNPDTGTGSALSKSLDDAVAAGDAATADRVGATITTKLEVARQQAAVAARWPTATTMLRNFDRVAVAYEAMIAAKRTAAAQPQSTANAQGAFENAGGVEAWTAMFETYRTVERPTGSSQANCPAVPIAP
jgi:hypothetical protein